MLLLHSVDFGLPFANDMTDKGLISNICKQLIQFNIKASIKKWEEELYRQFFQRGQADGQQAQKKILNIANHQANANQNHNEKSPHTCQNDYHQKEHK